MFDVEMESDLHSMMEEQATLVMVQMMLLQL